MICGDLNKKKLVKNCLANVLDVYGVNNEFITRSQLSENSTYTHSYGSRCNKCSEEILRCYKPYRLILLIVTKWFVLPQTSLLKEVLSVLLNGRLKMLLKLL